jgi:DNA-binding transcriptional MerR regulator
VTRPTYHVKELARATGVSVRTLHYYEEIGLLVPSARSPAGYRLYDQADALRLRQIVIERALGLSLEEVRRALDDPEHDRRQSLLGQKQRLLERRAETEAMLRAIDAELEAMDAKEQPPMKLDEMFDGFDPEQHAEEAKQRWGDTSSYAESQRRTQRYTKQDWEAFRAEQAALYAELADAMRNAKPPCDPEVRALVEQHRLSIDRWFYPCSREMHRGLADLYEADPRFAANIDKYAEGLSEYLCAAIRSD